MTTFSNRSARRALHATMERSNDQQKLIKQMNESLLRLQVKAFMLESAVTQLCEMSWWRRLCWAITGRPKVEMTPPVIERNVPQREIDRLATEAAAPGNVVVHDLRK